METERSGADWLGVEQGSLQMPRRKCYRVTKSELVVVMVAQLYITKNHWTYILTVMKCVLRKLYFNKAVKQILQTMVMQSRVHYKILLRCISEFLLKQINSRLYYWTLMLGKGSVYIAIGKCTPKAAQHSRWVPLEEVWLHFIYQIACTCISSSATEWDRKVTCHSPCVLKEHIGLYFPISSSHQVLKHVLSHCHSGSEKGLGNTR